MTPREKQEADLGCRAHAATVTAPLRLLLPPPPPPAPAPSATRSPAAAILAYHPRPAQGAARPARRLINRQR